MKYITKFAFLIVVLFVSCQKEAQSVSHSRNYKYEFLFEDENGCKLYRFYDGRYIYYSTCQGKVSSSYTTGSKHKTTHHDETLTNVIN